MTKIGNRGLNQLGPPPKVPVNTDGFLLHRKKRVDPKEKEKMLLWNAEHGITGPLSDDKIALKVKLGWSAAQAAQKELIKKDKRGWKAKREAREKAEDKAAKAISDACCVIELALLELQKTPAPNVQYQRSLLVSTVHNVVNTLRYHSGLKQLEKEQGPFAARIKLDEPSFTYVPLWERNKDGEQS